MSIEKHLHHDAEAIINEIEHAVKGAEEECLKWKDTGLRTYYDIFNFRNRPFRATIFCTIDNTPYTIHFTDCVVPTYPRPSNAPNVIYAKYYLDHGAIASLEIGTPDDIKIGGKDRECVLLRRHAYFPHSELDSIDAKNDTYTTHKGKFTVPSLRAVLDRDALPHIDHKPLIDELITDYATEDIVEFGMRSQFILDRKQDIALRAPHGKRTLLVGPPGSGKTTTLIKRIAFLIASLPNEEPRWNVLTSTSRFKAYAKEALAQEGLAAHEQRVWNWADKKKSIATDFGVLTPKKQYRGIRVTFRTSDRAQNPYSRYKNIEQATASALSKELQAAFASLQKLETNITATLAPGQSLYTNRGEIFRNSNFNELQADFQAILGAKPELERTLRIKTSSVRQSAAATRLMHNAPEKQESLAQTLQTLKKKLVETINWHIKQGTLQIPLSEEGATNAVDLDAALKAHGSAERTLTLARHRSAAKAADFFVHALPIFTNVENILRMWPASGARRIADIASTIVFDELMGHSGTDGKGLILSNDDLDIILAITMDFASELQGYGTKINPLGPHMVDILAIDEFTDFSPLEIHCQRLLCTRRGSIIVAGDSMQRSTSNGVRSSEELRHIITFDHTFELLNIYRMNDAICGVASAIYNKRTGKTLNIIQQHKAKKFIPPLFFNSDNRDASLQWITHKISELYDLYGTLPSVAILTLGERCTETADSLRPLLEDYNIGVLSCVSDDSTGNAGSVRVFPVENIKGLEFESVFIHDIAAIAARHPDLFDHYLYIAATRASRFLGITSTTGWPREIAYLSDRFEDQSRNP